MTWPNGFPTYQDICALYCEYVSRKFGPAIVVYDGYCIASTKYTTHQRRTGGKVGIEVTFTRYMTLTMSKDVFLSNVANKQNFIDMLSHYLQLAGCLTEHAEEDADLLIAQTAVQSTATKNTVHVADDTDLVILLCYYADPDGSDLFMQCRHGGQRRRTESGISKSPKVSWVLTSATTSCSYTRYWGVTPHPYYMVSEKDCRSRGSPSCALFRDMAEQFCKNDAAVGDVIDAGEAALVCLYSGRKETILMV